jgi:hypothetical protein
LKSNFDKHGREVIKNEKLAVGKRFVDIDCLILSCIFVRNIEREGKKEKERNESKGKRMCVEKAYMPQSTSRRCRN